MLSANKMMKLPELKMMMKENKIKGSSRMNKPEIIAVLIEKGIISDSPIQSINHVEQEIDPKYEFMMKLPELKMMMKENKIKGCSRMNKPEIITVLIDKGIISDSPIQSINHVKREIDPKYEFIRSIRNNPRSVEVRDLETGEINVYSSIYKASRAIDCSTKAIFSNNVKVGKKRYDIKIQ